MSWLLPTNLKLRHLEGISLRNLTSSKPAVPPRNKPIDDESLPTTFSSPAKLQAQRENLKLEHSRSSTDLRSHGGDASFDSKNGSTSGPQRSAIRPVRASVRRRSTLNWANETPAVRQKLLEDSVQERRLTTFFSLHKVGSGLETTPLYVSEEKRSSMNPDFKFFKLKRWTSREDGVIVRIWHRMNEGTQLLIEAEVFLGSLVRVGKSLDTFYHPLPDNCIIFHMTDGVYISFFDLAYRGNVTPFEALVRPQPTPRSAHLPPLETSSFDGLMKLKNLAECVDDAITTQSAIMEQIEGIIKQQKGPRDTIAFAEAAGTSTEAVQNALGKTRRSFSKLKNENETKRSSLEARRTGITKQTGQQSAAEATLKADEAVLQGRTEQHRKLKVEHGGQARRVAQQILDIFPIDPIEAKPLCFTILGQFLPNATTFEHETPNDEDSTAAALGYVAHIVTVLEQKLEAALPYPITVRGSTSEIFDPLSPTRELGSSLRLPEGEVPTRENSIFRIFPLYQKGAVHKRFNCGVYLLNKDIEELMSKHRLKVMDPRNTLANLKYLLTVLASGTGEMPQRKAGDVKALSTRFKGLSMQHSSLRDASPVSV